jgi:phosphoglycerate dehydrogenase-like enzyme
MDSKISVAVTELEYERGREVFERAAQADLHCQPAPADEEQLAAAVKAMDARHAIVGVAQYSNALYRALPRGGVLARFGVGYDGIDLQQGTQAGLLCTITPGTLAASVAELTLALLLSAARRIPTIVGDMRNGRWSPLEGVELHGRRIAIIGCGVIGKQVARIVSFGLGMDVIGCDIVEMDPAEIKERYGIARMASSFEDAVAEADYVSLHIPNNAETRHFINADSLSKMPAQCWLINTARGAVVDESALYDALAAGELGGAALDVFEMEPYVPVAAEKNLAELPNTILVPHVAGFTREACERMASLAVQNILHAEAKHYGKMNLLNREVL